jgi:hypothetical protein
VSATPPRLKSTFWVSAFLRRCEVAGKFGAVLHRGAEEAGAVFVVINHLDGTHHLLGPPPGPSINDEGERLFVNEFAAPVDWPTLREKIERHRKSDPDIWVVEVEDRTGLAGLKPSSP